MDARSSLAEDQRGAAVAWFEKGIADSGAAQDLAAEVGLTSAGLLKRWAHEYRSEGADALCPKPGLNGRCPATSGAARAGTIAAGKRTTAGGRGLPGKSAALRAQERG